MYIILFYNTIYKKNIRLRLKNLSEKNDVHDIRECAIQMSRKTYSCYKVVLEIMYYAI